MKRISLLAILLLGAVGLFLTGLDGERTVTSSEMSKINKTVENRTLPDQIIKRFWKLSDVELEASSVMLMDAETGHIIYEKNSDLSLPAASMSKMMTELLVLEALTTDKLDWESKVSISQYAHEISHHPGYASVELQKDRAYTVEELFEAMAIHSANGAAIALAEAVSGSEELFVQQMNNKAKELGLDASEFVNSTGLDNQHLGDFSSVGALSDTNKMSAKDLVTLAEYLLEKYPSILEITSQPHYLANEKEYLNTNRMLSGELYFEGVDGLKTGYTDLAGYCFTGTVQQGDVRLISVVMGTDSEQERFTETEKLYNKAFDQIENWLNSA